MRPMPLRCFSVAVAAIAIVQPALAAHPFGTASDPFAGKWRLDVARSTIVDEMRVEALGHNKYAFNFENAPTETIVADGTDQPGLPGTTLSVKGTGARTLNVVRKQEGRVIVSAIWSLSQDGRTLRDTFTSMQPDGSRFTVDYVYGRKSGSSGFGGAWESTTKPVGLRLELEIKPFGDKGLTFVSPGSDRNVIFDGREHPASGAKNDVTLSGRRRGARSMEYVENNRGNAERARQFQLSSDGRTLTETIRAASQATPDVLVFERE